MGIKGPILAVSRVHFCVFLLWSTLLFWYL